MSLTQEGSRSPLLFVLSSRMIWAFPLIFIFPYSCTYDEDFEFVPKTQAAYFLMQDDGDFQLAKVSRDGMIEENWGQRLNATNPSDIAGNAEELWVSQGDQSKLLRINLDSESLEESFDLSGFQAHYLSIGRRYLLLSDSVNQQIGFFNLDKHQLIPLSLDRKPGKAVYRSGKFYLILEHSEVVIYSEDALAPIDQITFGSNTFDLVLDNRFSTWVYRRDSLFYRSTISWNTNAIDLSEEEVNESKLRHSPYLQANFGKEFTGFVSLRGGQLSNFPAPDAEDFEVDFFEAKTYFVEGDSLYTLNIFSSEVRNLGPFSGSFRNAYFWVSM